MIAPNMFLGAAATLIASSTAFVAPMGAVRSVAPASSSRLTMQSAGSEYVSTLAGAPFPNGKIFDPLEFADSATPADIKKWREAEIKHGRVSMLACLGVVVAERFHPLFMGPDYIGPAVNHFQEITAQYPQFWTYAIFAMGLLEYRSITTAYGEPDPITGEGDLKEDYIPGNLGFDPLGMKPKNPTVLKSMETKELNNGRLAMIGIAGMLVQELVDPVNILNWI
eukprot:jgi/Undpi1/6117/HiC_scaffold_20.g08602.m1